MHTNFVHARMNFSHANFLQDHMNPFYFKEMDCSWCMLCMCVDEIFLRFSEHTFIISINDPNHVPKPNPKYEK